MADSPNLLVLIPTFNRPRLLGRLIGYYRSTAMRFPIHVADSSEAAAGEENRRIVEAAAGEIDIHHHAFPSTVEFHVKVNEVLGRQEAPLACLCADDDFTTPEGLRACGEFLASHPDYVAAHGVAVTIAAPGVLPGSSPTHIHVQPYRQRSLEIESPARRLVNHLAHYAPTFYSLQKRQTLMRTLQAYGESGHEGRFGELLITSLAVIEGKTRRLDVLFSARESHAEAGSRSHPRMADLQLQPGFADRYARLRESLVAALLEQPGITRHRAEHAVDYGFRCYLLRHGLKPEGLLGRMRVEAFRGLSLLREWSTAGARLDVDGRAAWRDLTLERLLDPASPYHRSFMPIHQAFRADLAASAGRTAVSAAAPDRD